MTAVIERDARQENLAALLDFAREACERAGLAADECHDVRLAVEEVCANVIAHGYAGRAPGPVSVAIEARDDAVVVRVEDRAPVFAPDDAPAPALDADWASRPVGGLGLHLVRRIMDEVRHEPRADGGNRLTLVRRRSSRRQRA